MNLFSLHLLMGAGGQPQNGDAGGGGMMTIVMFAAIIAIFYFLIIRPQNKKRKETEKMLSALKKGDKVVTIGGIHGTIQSVKEQTVILRIDDSTKIEFSRSAISTITAAGKEKAEKVEAKDDSESEASEDGGDDEK